LHSVPVFSRFRRARGAGTSAIGVLAVALVTTLVVPSSAGLAAAAPAPKAAGVVVATGITPPAGFSISRVVAGLGLGAGGNPTAFAYAPDGRIFIARKTGVLDVWDNGVLHVYVDLRDEVNSYQSRGLIGLALDPAFAANHRVYLLFTQELDPANPDSPAPAGGQLISLTNKANQPDVADPASRVTLMTGFDSEAPLHSVAGLRFGNDGSLFVGLGDGNGNGVGTGTSIKALDLDQLNGKILRIDPSTGDGVPSNPYYQPSAPGSVRSRVFARGFRNPFRFTVDPTNGSLYVGDVGWNTWEMFQVFPLSVSNPDVTRDAGWPCYEGGVGVSLVQPDYASAPATAAACRAVYTPAQGGTGSGALPPLYAYRHSDPGGDYGSAIVGGPRYTGTSNYPSSYVGKVFIGDYARSRVQTLDLATGHATDFGTPGSWANPVDMQIAPDGNVAFLAFGTSEIDEIVANGSNNPPVAVARANHTTTTASTLAVAFSSAGSSDPDVDPITYSWNFGDGSAVSTSPNPSHTYATGVFEAVLTVTDSHGASSTAKLQIDVGIVPPAVKFVAPATTVRFRIDDTIPVTVKATDAQDGTLAGASLSTFVEYWTGGHRYPVTDFNGASGSFVAADNGFANAFYRITTTATDSAGLSTVVTRDVLPRTSPITVTSSPPGLVVAVDGVQRTTPYKFDAIVGSAREAAAPTTWKVGGRTYTFTSWRVGSGRSASGTYVAYKTPNVALEVVATYTGPPVPPPTGYWIVDRAGQVHGFGAPSYGDLRSVHVAAPIVGMAATTTRHGYWLVGRDGGIFGFGDARFYGSTGALRLNEPIVGMTPTASGKGYWFVASDGGIFAYGDAHFYGSTGARRLNRPIVGMAATPSGHGYWLVASDGGVFGFGDAHFYGSTGAIHLNRPIVGMAATPSGHGYWFVASDGGIFGFGDAHFQGSTGAIHLNRPIVGMAATPSGLGYEFVADDGGIFTFGDAKYQGSLGANPGGAPAVGLG
jgi:glucose/arabinose dehydrogenase/ribosomal protein L24E